MNVDANLSKFLPASKQRQLTRRCHDVITECDDQKQVPAATRRSVMTSHVSVGSVDDDAYSEAGTYVVESDERRAEHLEDDCSTTSSPTSKAAGGSPFAETDEPQVTVTGSSNELDDVCDTTPPRDFAHIDLQRAVEVSRTSNPDCPYQEVR